MYWTWWIELGGFKLINKMLCIFMEWDLNFMGFWYRFFDMLGIVLD